MAARDVTAAAQRLAYPVPARGRRVEVATRAERIARGGEVAGLIALMAIGGFALWTAIPLGGLWLASQLTDSTHVSTGAALVAMVGIPVAMALGGTGLARLERRYMRLTGITRSPRIVPAYRRSISDSSSPPPASVLEKIMVVSVLAAASAFVGWFLLFAGSPLPA